MFTGLYLPPGIVGTCPVCPLHSCPALLVIPALVVEIWLGRSLSLYRRFCAPLQGHYSTARTRTVQRFGYSHPLAGPRDSVVLSALLVVVFLAETAVSTLLSVDIGRSLRLGMQLLPAVLLFFLVTEHFDGPRDIRLLYLTFSMLGIVLASRMLWVAWHANGTINLRVTRLGIPLLVDPNDLTFLAIIAPLSFVLLCHEARQSLCHHCWALHLPEPMCCVRFQESDSCTDHDNFSDLYHASYTQRRRRLATGLAALLALLLLALLLNALCFPNAQLVEKVIRSNYGTLSGRTPLWSAVTLFLDAPVLGHGPRTFGVFSIDLKKKIF